MLTSTIDIGMHVIQLLLDSCPLHIKDSMKVHDFPRNMCFVLGLTSMYLP